MFSIKACFVGFIFKKIVPIIKNQAVNLHTNGIMNRQRGYRFVVVLLLMLPLTIYSQQQLPLSAQKMPHTSPIFSVTNAAGRYRLDFLQEMTKDGRCRLNTQPFNIISSNFYTNHFGFFCRQELRFEKQTDIPLRVRLGSLEYVNKIERKGIQ